MIIRPKSRNDRRETRNNRRKSENQENVMTMRSTFFSSVVCRLWFVEEISMPGEAVISVQDERSEVCLPQQYDVSKADSRCKS